MRADITVVLKQDGMRILTFDGKKGNAPSASSVYVVSEIDGSCLYGFKTSVRAANVLQDLADPAQEAGCPLELVKIPRGGDPTNQCSEVIEFARSNADGVIGGLPKLKQQGPVCDAFTAALNSHDVRLEDASLPLAMLLVRHDHAAALQSSRKSAFLGASAMNQAIKYIEDCIDKRKAWLYPSDCNRQPLHQCHRRFTVEHVLITAIPERP